MKIRTKTFLHLLLCGSLLSSAPSSGYAKLQTYDGVKKVSWIKNGETRGLALKTFTSKDYLSISDVARIASAQVHWEPVSKKATLSRVDGQLTFQWSPSEIALNGSVIKKKFKLVYEDNQLYIPLQFLASGTFESFSRTSLLYQSSDRILVQNTAVNLILPPVENHGDHYTIGVHLADRIPYRIIEQSDKKIWIRFIRGRFEESQVLEGDRTVKEVRIYQKHRSADLVVTLGPDAGQYNLYYDEPENKLEIDVPTDKNVDLRDLIWSRGLNVSEEKRSLPTRTVQVDTKPYRTIIIDAGHGGIDSGAIGPHGTMEKDINLKIANDLAHLLKKEKGIRVIMTRTRDEFLSLEQRTDQANKAQADLFVSIHCNASLSARSTGFEVYVLSPKASDEAAAAVARIENSVVRLESKKGKKPEKLSELLASMAVYDHINESAECAAHICRGVKKNAPVPSTSVKEANFHVLRGAQMPGVLVELAYISNPITEIKLRSSRYRSQFVKGLVHGLLIYDQNSKTKLTSNEQKGMATR